MKYHSTRESNRLVDIEDAILNGLAPDGGLYVPSHFPANKNLGLSNDSFAGFASQMLKPFFEGSHLSEYLEEICRSAFDFPVPLVPIDKKASCLELFHGPTCAFKDFGARFLAECLQRMKERKPRLILVATSGDTGGAVASAFYKKDTKVVLLFPDKGVTPRQRAQLNGWGENIYSLAVHGSFDDCQAMVKSAFADSNIQARFDLTSANSINIARLLPQMAYHAFASLKMSAPNIDTTDNVDIVVPTGNMGNVLGCFWAKKIGLPIGNIHITTNANRAVYEYYQIGRYTPRPSVPTLANAMDVGAPSNMERLEALFESNQDLREKSDCLSVSNDDIQKTIKKVYTDYRIVVCPHTATAFKYFLDQNPQGPLILAATAHPAKFENTIEPLLGLKLSLPPALESIIQRPALEIPIDADPESLLQFLLNV